MYVSPWILRGKPLTFLINHVRESMKSFRCYGFQATQRLLILDFRLFVGFDAIIEHVFPPLFIDDSLMVISVLFNRFIPRLNGAFEMSCKSFLFDFLSFSWRPFPVYNVRVRCIHVGVILFLSLTFYLWSQFKYPSSLFRSGIHFLHHRAHSKRLRVFNVVQRSTRGYFACATPKIPGGDCKVGSDLIIHS